MLGDKGPDCNEPSHLRIRNERNRATHPLTLRTSQFPDKKQIGYCNCYDYNPQTKNGSFRLEDHESTAKKTKNSPYSAICSTILPFHILFSLFKNWKINVNLWGNYQTLNKRFKNQVFWHYHKI
jgi:hypothetical protein